MNRLLLILFSFLFVFSIIPKISWACIDDSQCKQPGQPSGQFCEIDPTLATGKCVPLKNLNEKCYYDSSCLSKKCDKEKCVTPVAGSCSNLNDTNCIGKCYGPILGKYICGCTEDSHCASDQFCFKTTALCTKKYPMGTSCTQQNSNWCYSGVCECLNGGTDCKCSAVTSKTVTQSGQQVEIKPENVSLSPPKLNVDIPGFKGFSIMQLEPGKILSVNWLNEYLIAVYKYAIVIGSIIAVLILMINGFNYLLSSSGISKQQNKTNVINSLLGLIILISSYSILYFINPKLVVLESVELDALKVEIDPAILETKSFQVKGGKPHIKCDANGKPVAVDTGKPIDQSLLFGNGKDFSPHPGQKTIPFYETCHGMTRRKKKVDLILVHSTAGNGFLPRVDNNGGPAVHYQIDNNGDVVQFIFEEDAAHSVKNSKQGLDVIQRSISYEIVNLYDVCGSDTYQKNQQRRSGNSLGSISKKHPLCLTLVPISPETKGFCPCEDLDKLNKDYKKLIQNISNDPKASTNMNYCYAKFPEEQLRSVAKLTAWIAKRYQIPIQRPITDNPPDKSCPAWNAYGKCWDGKTAGIIGHNEIAGQTHADPGPAFPWDRFINMVQQYMSTVPATSFAAEEHFNKTFGKGATQSTTTNTTVPSNVSPKP